MRVGAVSMVDYAIRCFTGPLLCGGVEQLKLGALTRVGGSSSAEAGATGLTTAVVRVDVEKLPPLRRLSSVIVVHLLRQILFQLEDVVFTAIAGVTHAAAGAGAGTSKRVTAQRPCSDGDDAGVYVCSVWAVYCATHDVSGTNGFVVSLRCASVRVVSLAGAGAGAGTGAAAGRPDHGQPVVNAAAVDRVASLVQSFKDTPVYEKLVSAYIARCGVLFQLQCKAYEGMVSRKQVSYMGAIALIADFRTLVRPQ